MDRAIGDGEVVLPGIEPSFDYRYLLRDNLGNVSLFILPLCCCRWICRFRKSSFVGALVGRCHRLEVVIKDCLVTAAEYSIY